MTYNPLSTPAPTITEVAAAFDATRFVPSRVLAQVMSLYATTTNGADMVDGLGSILSHIHAVANLPSLDSDDEQDAEFWTSVAIDGAVL